MTTSPAVAVKSPGEHPVLAAVRQLAPRVASRSEEIESARHLPADLARELAAAGLFHMVIPEAYGGLELHPLQIIEAIEEISKADGSAGWCVMIGSVTAMCAAWLPESTARTIYGAPDVITGGVAAPQGRAELVEGGYRVTGRWSWASGSQNCHWLTGGVVVTKDGAPRMVREGIPETRILFFPREDVTLHDTWHATGLCGTGSGDMEVRDVFVPAERALSLLAGPRVDRPLYAFPAFGLLGVGLPAVALGIARRAIDELTALAQHKKIMPLGRHAIATRPAVQEAVAEAEATLRAARAFLLETVNTTYEAATRREVTLRHRAELRLAYTHATRSAARVVDRMYEVAGGAAVYRSSPLQRCLRDIHVATQHAMVAQPILELVGSVLLGQEANTVML
ncbi:acyl-CoA dehydrogenase family protein [Vitiosangium sp. GDMCC 1.1324]|uniref:acyl-CoA dehydrogenase family protein n=1 Tax=Vitiosangium sp. (strain GDMCC 1.1324) TaxID=2138576 RepID=UPI000D356416|nr:acyl-CoA dehydrogenase family protein [Vitiosangium sp. GDMCC 1.1324]PTL85398.1 hydrolase [Vitiosangium sp. GDMCC 1.1324]